MKVLIFGVTGNSGQALARYYLERGAVVYGVGRRNKPCGFSGLQYFRGDIQDVSLYSKLPSELDLVINLAGVQPSILHCSESSDLYKTLREYLDVNIYGVYNVIEWVSTANVKTYIYTTTHRDYEEYWGTNIRLKNDLPPAINYEGDHTMYAISKVVGQMMGDYLLPLKKVRCFNLRLPMIFTVPDSPYYLVNGEKKVMPFLKVIKDALDGKPLEIWGDPNMPRDYVYIDNLINMVDRCESSNLTSGTFSVGTGEAASTEYFIKTIAEVFSPEKEPKFIYHPEKLTYKCAVYDVDEQRQLLGYEPVLLRSMLERMRDKMFSGNYLSKWGWAE
jgi:UDP-glucose 4-epimerase